MGDVWDAILVYGQPRFAIHKWSLTRTLSQITSDEIIVPLGCFWNFDHGSPVSTSNWVKLGKDPYLGLTEKKLEQIFSSKVRFIMPTDLSDLTNQLLVAASEKPGSIDAIYENAFALASQMAAITNAYNFLREEIDFRGSMPRFVIATRSDVFLRTRIHLSSSSVEADVTTSKYNHLNFDDNFVIYKGNNFKALNLELNPCELIASSDVIGAENLKKASVRRSNPQAKIEFRNIKYSLIRSNNDLVIMFGITVLVFSKIRNNISEFFNNCREYLQINDH